MTIRSLTTLLCDQKTDSHALLYARDLAERLKAHLDVWCLGVDATRFDSLTAGGVLLAGDGAEQARTEAETLMEWAKSKLGAHNESIMIDHLATQQLLLEQSVARAARYTDLIVAASPHGAGRTPLSAMVFEAALFAADAAMLVVPDHVKPLPRFRNVVIAWKESSEALNAVRRAIPLIEQAENVHVVMIDPPSTSAERSDPGGALSFWLGHHGARCEVSVLNKSEGRVSEIIRDFATQKEADLLVMGAYSHSRFREALFGGATRDLLHSAPCAVFMAH